MGDEKEKKEVTTTNDSSLTLCQSLAVQFATAIARS